MIGAGDSPKTLLNRYELRAKKHFGQNFLADERLALKIAELCTTPPGGTVLELGAGLGALTRPLLERAAHVCAVERDRDLVPILSELFAAPIESGHLSLLEADAKAVDLAQILGQAPRPRVLAGNLPYQITGPLLERAVGAAGVVDRVVFLVQLEVADRLAATPDHDAYGALSVYAQAQFKSERAFVIRRGAFYPQPGVDSAVVVLEPLPVPVARETPTFRALVAAAFQQRRKTLRNAWSGVIGTSGPALADAAVRAGIDLDARGERLLAADFARMARALGDGEQPDAP
jgi:16S rRNA (adenine1518-N6/adenine1519-N6)-dimethyltransferase